jgi:hypothetical protein
MMAVTLLLLLSVSSFAMLYDVVFDRYSYLKGSLMPESTFDHERHDVYRLSIEYEYEYEYEYRDAEYEYDPAAET